MERRDRVLLYAVMLLVILASGFIAWTSWDRPERLGTPPYPVPPTGLAELRDSIDDLASRLGDHDRSVSQKLEELAKAVRAITPSECAPDPEPCPEREPASLAIASTFTLLYENARLHDDRSLTGHSRGIRLAPHHEQRLAMIERAFEPCQAHGTEEVAFDVTGFSSTAEFQEETPTGRRPMRNSDELNVQTANLRADVVAAHLRSAGFAVETPNVWESIDQIRRSYLGDAPPGTDRQALNRSVYVKVRQAGACDLR